MQVQESIQNYLDMEDEKLSYLAKEIWDHPEIGLAGDLCRQLALQ